MTEKKTGNQNIAKHGESTRFGSKGGPDPSAAGKASQAKAGNPSSIRSSLRRLMAAEVDFTKPIDPSDIVKMFGKNGMKVTLAQACAIRKVQQAMGNWKAMDSLTDQVDGKQVQATVEAKTTMADLLAASFDATFLEGDIDESDEDEEGGSPDSSLA